jgi:hypothetical protein
MGDRGARERSGLWACLLLAEDKQGWGWAWFGPVLHSFLFDEGTEFQGDSQVSVQELLVVARAMRLETVAFRLSDT